MDNLKKMNQVLLFIALLFLFLYLGSSFLIPFVFGIFFTTLITPLCNYFEVKLKFSRTLASLASTLVLFIVAGSILFLFIYQISQFISDFSAAKEQIQSIIKDIRTGIASMTDISEKEQQKIWEERSQQAMEKIEPYITGFFSSIFSTFGKFLLMLAYVFLLLLYREKFTKFAMMYSKNENKKEVRDILNQTGGIAYQYLLGRIKVMGLLAIMYIITFFLFDLPYAVLLTLFGALVTVIPYLGPLISGILPVLFAVIFFDDMKKIVFFAIVVLIIQLIESYLLEPMIMGKQIELNPLVVIIMIIIGGIVWGLAGMILFVPMFAMFKIISAHKSALRPISFLVSDSVSKNPKK
jgi:predicted PurR-regulated permease PerM